LTRADALDVKRAHRSKRLSCACGNTFAGSAQENAAIGKTVVVQTFPGDCISAPPLVRTDPNEAPPGLLYHGTRVDVSGCASRACP
jgi:hypothetical protein